MKLLLWFAVVGQVLDGVLTYLGMRAGWPEGNPMIAWLMERIGVLPSIFSLKVLSIAAICFIYFYGNARIKYYGLLIVSSLIYAACIMPWLVVLWVLL